MISARLRIGGILSETTLYSVFSSGRYARKGNEHTSRDGMCEETMKVRRGRARRRRDGRVRQQKSLKDEKAGRKLWAL